MRPEPFQKSYSLVAEKFPLFVITGWETGCLELGPRVFWYSRKWKS